MPEIRATHKFLGQRAVLIGAPISEQLFEDVADAFAQLKRAGQQPVTVYINSPGGVVSAAEALMDLMNLLPLTVSTYCVGLASGISAHVFLSARRRYAVSDAMVRFSQVRGDDRVESTQIDVVAHKVMARTAAVLKIPVSRIESWMEQEKVFSGADLLTHNLVHEMA